MKIIMMTTALFLSTSYAHAFPKVGDQAVLRLISGTGVSYTDTQVVTAVDDSKNQFQVHEVLAMGAQTQAQDLVSDIAITQYLMQSASSADACSKLGQGFAGSGVIESISVLGTVINTCRVLVTTTDPSGNTQTFDFWFGDVPFGVVKEQVNNVDPAQSGVIELVSYIRN